MNGRSAQGKRRVTRLVIPDLDAHLAQMHRRADVPLTSAFDYLVLALGVVSFLLVMFAVATVGM